MWFQHRDKTLGINLDLVADQKITFETFCEIILLHKERYDLFEELRKTKDETLMKIIFNQLTEIEYEIQMLWGWQPNAIMHRSYLWPHCKCPTMDNRDAYPVAQYVDKHCPLHGEGTPKKQKK